MLRSLCTRNVGPSKQLDVDFKSRINLLTGDNGLGKTFVLDIAWWALTGTWTGDQAWPDPKWHDEPKISYEFMKPKSEKFPHHGTYNYFRQAWNRPARMPPESIVVYARVDEGFSVWDPVRNYWKTQPNQLHSEPSWPEVYHFTREQLWNGLKPSSQRSNSLETSEFSGGYSSLCDGLLRDWVLWQLESERDASTAFETLTNVLRCLSPDPERPGEVLHPERPVRVSVADVTKIPTIAEPYGVIPVIYASAAIRRILGLAYLLVWTWYEHQQAALIMKQDTAKSLVLLVDEVEAHLHPRWQRQIVESLLSVVKELDDKIQVQLIATTHAPLVLAALEPIYDDDTDQVLEFSIEDGQVTLEQFEWTKFGSASSWLTSPIFGLDRAFNRMAEKALNAAHAYLANRPLDEFEGLQSQEEIDKALRKSLPLDHPIWAGWNFHLRKRRDLEESHDSLR